MFLLSSQYADDSLHQEGALWASPEMVGCDIFRVIELYCSSEFLLRY